MASVVLLSGGLDSVVATWAARAEHPPILGITFDYGQRAASREIASALQVCADLNITHRLIKLPWLAKLTPPPVSDPDADLAAATDRSVWVPARNAVFLSIAASFAETLDCDAIICGFNAEEAATFPDNSPEFVRRFDAMLELATQNAIVVPVQPGAGAGMTAHHVGGGEFSFDGELVHTESPSLEPAGLYRHGNYSIRLQQRQRRPARRTWRGTGAGGRSRWGGEQDERRPPEDQRKR